MNKIKRVSFLSCSMVLVFTAAIQAQTRYLKQDMVLVKGAVDTLYFENNEFYENPAVTDTMGYYAVTKIEDFYMSAYCVSELDYLNFSKATKRDLPPAPSYGWGDYKTPMVNVNYLDALDFCQWLSDSLGVQFRLPTAYEWEFAANQGRFYNPVYDFGIDNIDDIAVHKDNYRGNGKPNCITCKQPNNLGIYDLLGNVWEITDGLETKGGSFLSAREEVSPQTSKNISEIEIAEDMGFRIVANAEDFKKYLIAQEANRLTSIIFGNNKPFVFSAKGISIESDTISWKDFETFKVDLTKNRIQIIKRNELLKNNVIESFTFPEKNIEQVMFLQAYLESNLNKLK